MKIEIKKSASADAYMQSKKYLISIYVKDGESLKSVFLRKEEILEGDSYYIDINNLSNKDFLETHQIEYIIEKDIFGNDKIIPIGLVDFTSKGYYNNELNVMQTDMSKMYKTNQILKNIQRAIEIKYEAIKFIHGFAPEIVNVEEIEL